MGIQEIDSWQTKGPEYYWQKASEYGLDRLFRGNRSDENYLVGRVFELLGYSLAIEQTSPFYLTHPFYASRLKDCLQEDDFKWQPSFPDGLLFKTERQVVKIGGIVEYKIANLRNLAELKRQFDGFINLIDLLKRPQGISILKKFLRQEIDQLIVTDDIRLIYVTPKDRTANNIPTSLYGLDIFKELVFPQSSGEIRRKVKNMINLKNIAH